MSSFKHLSLFTLTLCCANLLHAKPEGCRVISGNATLDPSQLKIETGPKTILEWDSFSLQNGEQFQFQQFDANSAVLNRVTGPEASAILGTLLSNGKVYLINPNGVLIGPGGRIETAAFVASSLDILHTDFLADHFVFAGESLGAVVNLGQIVCPAGHVALIGRKVTNEGQIDAKEGQVALASGMEVLLQLDGEQTIFIRPQTHTEKDLKEEGVALEQKGTIQALTIELKSGNSPYTQAIHHSGQLSADSLSEKQGRIFLVADQGINAVSGKIQATGQVGGNIQVLGEHVHLTGNAHLDASGIQGGGEVLIGGDFQGKNPAIFNAKTTCVEANAKIQADAIETGKGGKIIHWADESMQFHGTVSAKGGALEGDGGFIEISSPLFLDISGIQPDVTASLGTAGQIFFDPPDVTINTSTTTPGTFPACSFTPGSTASITINTTDLQTCLASGNVIIDTSAGTGSGPNGGSITVSSPINWSTSNTLTLNANAFISVSAAITNTSSTTGFTALQMNAAPTANATSAITIGANITTDGGDILATGVASGTTGTCHGITITSSSAVTSGAGNIRLMGVGGTSSTASHGFSIPASTSGRVVSTSGTISIAGSASGTAGSAGVSSSSTTAFASSTSGAINISGKSTATGSGSAGVTIGTSWAPVTSGTVTFGSSITDGVRTISGCQATAGLGSSGLALTTYTCPSGTTIGTNNIIGGAGNNCVGFFASTIQSGGPLQITASSQATSSSGHGISIGTLQSPTSGTTRLIGTASPTYSSSNGVNITTLTANTNGSVSLGGISTGSGSIGVSTGTLSGTGTGTISISGTSERTTGVVVGGNISYPGDLVFGSTITDGTVFVTGCQGGSVGSNAHGLSIASTTATVGSLTAINSIIGGTGSGSCGFNLTGALVAAGDGDLLITASTLATGASASHGINIASTASISSAGSGTIRLIGTASASNAGSSNGVNLAGTIFNHTGTGAIQVAGSVPSGATGTGVGVLLSSTNPITARGGSSISISGTSLASGTSSHGVAFLNDWTTYTKDFVTFGSSITDGTVTINGCQGGIGTESHGIFIGAPLSTDGGLIATDSIIGGSGAGSYGFYNPLYLLHTGNEPSAISAYTNDGSSTGLLLGNSFLSENGALILTGSIRLSDSIVLNTGLSGGAITIDGTVNGSGHSLYLYAGNGAVSMNGALDLSAGNGGSLFVDCAENATFAAAIDVSGTTDGGAVQITSRQGSIIVDDIDTSGTSGKGGSIWLQPSCAASAGAIGFIPQGTVKFTGTTYQAAGATSGGAISIAPLGRNALPAIATIFGDSIAENSVSFTGDSFTMGANEAMTVFGDVTINTTKAAVVADIVALNTLSITASKIFLIERNGATLLVADGSYSPSTSAHLLSGNAPVFSTSVIPAGSHTGLSGANKSDLIYTTDNYPLNFD